MRDNDPTDLNVISDLQEVEEGPDKRDDEAGDHDKEEEVVVPDAPGLGGSSGERDAHCGSSARHADHTKDLRGEHDRVLH